MIGDDRARQRVSVDMTSESPLAALPGRADASPSLNATTVAGPLVGFGRRGLRSGRPRVVLRDGSLGRG